MYEATGDRENPVAGLEPQDAVPGELDRPATPEEAAAFLGGPDNVHISLEEAPLEAPDGMVGIQVPVNVIMDQIHQHWARQLADQIQRNAELSAALTSVSDELNEVRSKLAALTEVTNAPAEQTTPRVRDIPSGGPVGRQEDPPAQIDHPV